MENHPQYHHCVAVYRYLARRKLEFCAVGRALVSVDSDRKGGTWKTACTLSNAGARIYVCSDTGIMAVFCCDGFGAASDLPV